MKSKIVTLSPSVIRTEGMQLRADTCPAHVDDIAELFDDDKPIWPAELPPIVVFHDGKAYWCPDGHHRLAGAVQAGCKEIRVEIRKGTKADAIRYACGANAGHGLRRTTADKRSAVKAAIENKLATSERNLANLCRVSRSLVRDVMQELVRDVMQELKGGLKIPPTDHAPAKETGAEGGPGGTGEGLGQDETTHSTPMPGPLSAPAVIAGAGLKIPPREHETGGEEATPNSQAPPVSSVPNTAPVVPPPVNVDAAGLLIRSDAGEEAFLAIDHFAGLESLLSQAAKALNALAKMKGAERLRNDYLKLTAHTVNGETVERFHSPDLENLRKELRHWQPFASVCPHCRTAPKDSCRVCLGLPYVIRSAWERTPETLREAAIDAAKSEA